MRLAMLAMGLAFLACSCGGGDSGEQSGSALRVTRDDGSRVKFSDDLHAFCARAPSYEGEDKPGAMELWVVAGELPPEEEDRKPGTYWVFSRPTQEIKRARKVRLPDEEMEHASLFVFDADTEGEFSSHEEYARGSVEVREWGCDKGDSVRISVDATLDHEGHGEQPVVEAEGEVETVIGDPLPIPD